MGNPQCSAVQCSALLLSLGASQGCSTAATDPEDPPDENAFPSGWGEGEYLGWVIHCQLTEEPEPTTGDPNPPSEGYTCVAEQSYKSAYNPSCDEMALYPLYLQAVCAKTFGGNPSDYLEIPVGGWVAPLQDYPISGNVDVVICDVSDDFDLLDEVPSATNMVPLPSGQLDRCSRESYCNTYKAMIEEFPENDPEIILDPWCNVSPSGDEEAPGPWLCVGSSVDACGYIYDTQPICPMVKPGGKEWCVIATGEEDASEKCTSVCNKDDLNNIDSFMEDYTTPLSCGVYDMNEMEWVSDVIGECYNPDNELNASAKPFRFDADLMLDNGGSASSDDISNLGWIEYRVENCVGTACDIIIDGLALSYAVHSGVFYDDEENPYPYSVDGVSVHLARSTKGLVTSYITSPPTVTFPADNFSLHVSAGDVELDSVSLGTVGPLTLPVTQVIGTHSGGILTLYIAYESVDATMLITLTTF